MLIEPVGPARAIAPVASILHHGPTGQSFEHDGPEARWGEGADAARAYDARARSGAPVWLRGHAEPPTPFVPPHHERWGAYVWLRTPDERVRVLLGPVQPFTAPALRLQAGDEVEVFGYRIHEHEEDVIVAATVAHGREQAVLLDDERHRLGMSGPQPDR